MADSRKESDVFRVAIKTGFALATVIFLVAVFQVVRSGLNIDTNLRSLAPHLSENPLKEDLINQLSNSASRKAVVVLAADNAASATAAAELMRAKLTSSTEDAGAVVRLLEMDEAVERYVRLLERYPYNFLRPSLAATLSKPNDAELTQWVLEQLYGSQSQIRLTEFNRDAFGSLNDYILYVQEHLAQDAVDDVQSVVYQGVTQYFTAWQFELPADGMALDTQAEWIARVTRIKDEMHAQFPDLQWLQSGVVFFAADSAQSAQRNINAITTFGMLGVVFLMLAIFRGVRPLIASVMTVSAGVVFAFALCHSIWGSLHILTLLFGASLIGVAVDYSLHLYYFHLDDKAAAVQGHRQHFYRALLLSLLTSVVGYGALAMSGLETLKQVAAFSIAGLTYACLLVLVLEPWSTKRLTARDATVTAMARAGVKAFRRVARLRYFLLFSVVIWIAALAFNTRLTFDDSPKAFIKPNPQLLANERMLSEWLADYEPATFVLVEGKDDQEVFDKIEQLNARLKTEPEVFIGAKTDLLGVHLLIPSPRQQLDNYRLSGSLYSNDGLTSTLVKDYEIFTREQLAVVQADYRGGAGSVLTPAAMLEQLREFPQLWLERVADNGDKSIVTALLVPKNASVEALGRVTEKLPDTELVSMVKQTENGLHKLRNTASYFLLLALVLIGAIFTWRYGWRQALVLISIPVTVVGCICLAYLWASIPITLFHVMAAFLVVGLGVDYLVFVAEMYSDKASSTHFANALLLSAVTSTLSFGLLSLSVLPAVQAFGMTAMLGIFGNLVGAFWLISIWQDRREQIS